jgi:hypothetical protein
MSRNKRSCIKEGTILEITNGDDGIHGHIFKVGLRVIVSKSPRSYEISYNDDGKNFYYCKPLNDYISNREVVSQDCINHWVKNWNEYFVESYKINGFWISRGCLKELNEK